MPACGQPAVDQTFGHHSMGFEIDLCGFHASSMLDFILEPFKASARAREIREYQP